MSNQPQAHVADERAAFEAWASDPVRSEKLPLDRWPTNDGYKDSRTYIAYYGFKAGRAAIPAGANLAADVRALADKWNREAIAAGFAASEDAYALYEILGDFRAAGAPSDQTLAANTNCAECGWEGHGTSIESTGPDDGFGPRGACPQCAADEGELGMIAAGAPAETPKPTGAKYEYQPRYENGMLMEWAPLDVDTDAEADAYCNYGQMKWRHAAQPAPASATDARDGERDALDAERYHWLRDPSGQKAEWQLEAMDKQIDAAMRVPSSPSEAG